MFKFRLHLTSIFLSALLFTSSCHDEDNEANGCMGGTFNFLTVGNHWESSFSGSLFSSDTLLMATVLEETEPGIFKLRTYSEPNNHLDATYYLQDCGDFLLRSATLPIRQEDKYMKGTRSVGDSWQYTDRATNIVSNYQVLAKNVSITTPLGTFTCDRISYYQEGSFNTDTMYINNDYLFIKYDGIIQYELISKNF